MADLVVGESVLSTRPVWHEGGWINPPEGPGLGITVNEDHLRHARLDQ
jgi:L-alanine-DL-glutamate epimerase-like enolase superfamily enzyme